MPKWEKTCWWPALAAIVLGLLVTAGWPGRAGEPGKPRLAVIVVFDQMRGDYPAKWQKLFGQGGLRRLQEEGAWFTNCHYPYAFTWTAAGHTSLATGCSPDKHGVIGNEWYDRDRGKEVDAVRDDRYEQVPSDGGKE